ncbi:MAG: hypothetical protein [Caudoviricetes sp.]|nr:MAG: hypothetical protein [Caudoviricetes sp.]
MAVMKSGSTVGGNLIWHQGILDLNPSDNSIYFKTHKLYSSNDKPTNVDVGLGNVTNDAQVKKAGDTMTGVLKLVQPGATSIFEIGANSQIMSDSAYKALILSPSKDTDGTIYFRPSKASGTHALQTTITGTGLTSPQVYVSSPQVNAVNALVRKDFLDGRIQDVAREHVNINGDVMKGELTVPSSINIVGPSNRHVWFKDSAGVEKGLVYSDAGTGNLNIRANGTRLFIFGADGNFTFPSSVVGPNAVFRGSIYFDDKPQGTYETTNLSTAANNNGTNLLRRFRSQGNSSIFHEVVQANEVRYSHGINADASPIWKYHTQGIDIVNKLEVQNWTIGPSNMLILKDGQSVNGEANGLVRGAVQGGAWVEWRARASGLQVNITREDSAYNIWKATLWGKNHVAAMQVLHTTDVNNAIARLQVHNTAYDFGASGGLSVGAKGYFAGDLVTNGNLRSANGLYWGPNGAWAASDGNIYGTQWGEGGTLAWMGGNVVKTWGNQTKKGNLDVQGVLRCTGGSDFHTEGATIHNKRIDFMYVRADGDKIIRFQPANASGTQASIIANAGFLRINPGAGNFEFKNNNEFYCPGNGNFNDVYIRSDRNAKRNIVEIDNALSRLEKMTGSIYEVVDESGNWNQSVGLIAQDAQDALPELVHMDDKDLLRLNYNGVIGLLVSAVNELRVQIDELKK